MIYLGIFQKLYLAYKRGSLLQTLQNVELRLAEGQPFECVVSRQSWHRLAGEAQFGKRRTSHKGFRTDVGYGLGQTYASQRDTVLEDAVGQAVAFEPGLRQVKLAKGSIGGFAFGIPS